MSNHRYQDEFSYIGANIPEREKLIKDMTMDEDRVAEQSDLVILLLNLAYIPDEAVRRIDFSKPFK